MKAAVTHQYGGPEALGYEDFADPVAGHGEVLVQVAAAGVNPIDIAELAGMLKDVRPISFPAIIGWDLSGTVVKLGPETEGLAVGDKVAGWAYHTYAELCAVRADLLAKVPAGLDLVDAAALPLVTLTGSQLVSLAADVQPGQTVLVAGAIGSVGRSAVFTAKDLGATVIAGVLQKQVREAASLGASQVVALDDMAALQALPPVDVVANTVRGPTVEQLMAKVTQGGTFASVTGAPGNAGDYPSVRVVSYVSKQDSRALAHLMQAVADGKLTIPVGRRMPLREAAQAHALFAAGGVGKVLLIP